MAKIICVTTGLTGILNASFELVARLKANGHQVLYASPRNVAKRVEQQGIAYSQLGNIRLHPGPELPAFSGGFKKIKRLLYKIRHAKKRRAIALENTNPMDFAALLATESPDLLLIDIELHEYIFKAYKQKSKFILLSQWFSLWNRPGLPYLLYDTIPNKDWAGQNWMIQLSWLKVKWKRWWTFTKQKWYTVFTDRRSVLLELAKQEKFPLQYIRENYWPGPFTYDKLPVMSMTAWEMEFPHVIRPNLFYIGPMVQEFRVENQVNSVVNDQLEAALLVGQNNEKALIYCSVSTLHEGDHQFISKLIQAVATQRNWILIISLGGLIQEALLPELPKNVFAFSYVPQLKVLQQADCSINHGGIHTINECIHFKVPMLIYSGKRSDQNGCAARVAYHRLGIMADKDKDDSIAIRTRITQLLEDTSFKINVARMKEHFVKYQQNACLENKIQAFLATAKTVV